MDAVFAAVADPTRREILDQLRAHDEQSIKDLTPHFAMTRQALTKHLDVLERADLVVAEVRGRERLHRLNPEPLQELDAWLAPYSAAWDRRLSRLKDYLEGRQ
jgi:DNA-binding transcriptional ArsR family regulator